MATTKGKRRVRQYRWTVTDIEGLHVVRSHEPGCEIRDQASALLRDGQAHTLPCAHAAKCDCQSPVPSKASITLYTGERGSGKTLSLVGHVSNAYANGVEVYHNGALLFGHELDLEVFLANTYTGVILAFDELEEYLNNLRMSSNLSVDFVGVLIQLRHQDCEIVATTQRPGEVNRRFRDRVDSHASCVSHNDGKTVLRYWRGRPWSTAPGRRWRDTLLNAQRYHSLYNHKHYVSVGNVRVTARQLGALQEIRRDELIWGVLVDAVKKGYESVTGAEVQQALHAHENPVVVSKQQIGRSLRDFRLTEHRAHDGPREWIIPEEVRVAIRGDQADS